MKLISLYTHLNHVGGANNLCVTLHNSLMSAGIFAEGKVSSFTDYEKLAPSYKKELTPESYVKFKAYKLIKNVEDIIFLSHHRKMTTYLLGLSKLLRKDATVVHVAHTMLSSLKYATLLPKYNIAVSNSVKQNLETFFKVKDVKVIYNGVLPVKFDSNKTYDSERIIITMPALICDLKQQLSLTHFLKNKLPKQVTIQFAGNGPDLEELREMVTNDEQFKVLGHVDTMHSIYKASDYVLLYSKKEGLPLCLIEAQSYGVPIICNDVGGNLEILKPEVNGFLTDSMPELLECLKSLPNLENSKYQEMRAHSLQNFKANFQFDKMIDQYVALLQEIIQLED